MAKQPPKAQASAPALPKKQPPKFKTVKAYRVEKLSQYEWQGYEIVLSSDGTFTETIYSKPSLFPLVMRRIYEAMNIESHAVFKKNRDAEPAAPTP